MTMTFSAVCATTVHFPRYRSTGKERDTESGNDYFGARYYSSAMGRFMSPDWSAKVAPVPYAKLDNPQSLNLYVYVLNHPMSGVDPDGHECNLNCQWNNVHKIATDAIAAIKTATLTVETGGGLKIKGEALDKKGVDAHLGATVHGEAKFSMKGIKLTGKAEVDAGISMGGKGGSIETGYQKSINEDNSVTPIERYTETSTSSTIAGREVENGKEDYSIGGALYEGYGDGAKVSIGKEAVDKVIDDIVDVFKQAVAPGSQPKDQTNP
jgi:RHS repeat-associated protein